MNHLASLDLKVAARPTILQDHSSELLHIIIGLVDCLFVLHFAIFQLLQVVHHVVVDLLPCNVSQLCIVLDLLVLNYAIFCFACRLEVCHGSALDICVDQVQLILPLLRQLDHSMKLGILRLDQLLQRRDTILVHILADFGCLPSASCAAHLVILHLFRQVADFERFGVVGDLVEAHRVRQLRLNPIIEHINDFLRFFTPGHIELFLML